MGGEGFVSGRRGGAGLQEGAWEGVWWVRYTLCMDGSFGIAALACMVAAFAR